MFTTCNMFVSGKYAWRFADPLGALLIALLIVFNWIRTVRSKNILFL